MDELRAQITPTIDLDGFVKIKIDWVRVVDSQVGEVIASEEFRISSTRVGCSYISRAAFNEGNFLPGTFWTDEQGKRHFIVQVNAGTIDMKLKGVTP